jgi:hypothetical protein
LELQPEFFTGVVDEVPVLDVPGEVFVLRKLIPMSMQYDFNIHVSVFHRCCSSFVHNFAGEKARKREGKTVVFLLFFPS